MSKTSTDTIVYGSSQLLTLDPAAAGGGEPDPEAAELGAIAAGALAIRDGIVVDVGPTEKIRDLYEAGTTIDARDHVVAPGFVDPHTHVVFAGSRHLEFGMRMRGASYLEILSSGGGIHSTVRATREAPLAQLIAESRPRLAASLAYGVTTLEIKSGYGLDEETEIKMLEAVAELSREQPLRLVPTYLGAHVVPKEHKQNREQYLDLMMSQVIPRVAEQGLARACDVFLDDGAFDSSEARSILEAAASNGLELKIHAGQFTDQGGPQLIAELGGKSADHLEQISDDGIEAMAGGGVVATLLPGAAFSLRDHFPDGRRLIDGGVRVALATDNNPGSSRTENLPLMASMGVARMGLTCAEAWQAITTNAARALGIEDEAGALAPGRRADLVLLAIPDFRSFLYHFGVNHAVMVMARGSIAVDRRSGR
jgi:imidazolonepropionase